MSLFHGNNKTSKDTILIALGMVITFFVGLKIQSLHDTNIAIKEELERARAEVIYVEPATIEAYIEYVFGPAFPKAMLLLKGTGGDSCAENRNLDPLAINDNTTWGGVGRDIGVFQINSKWQKVQVKFLYNWRINVLIAKQLYDESGSFKLWSCGRYYMSRGEM